MEQIMEQIIRFTANDANKMTKENLIDGFNQYEITAINEIMIREIQNSAKHGIFNASINLNTISFEEKKINNIVKLFRDLGYTVTQDELNFHLVTVSWE